MDGSSAPATKKVPLEIYRDELHEIYVKWRRRWFKEWNIHLECVAKETEFRAKNPQFTTAPAAFGRFPYAWMAEQAANFREQRDEITRILKPPPKFYHVFEQKGRKMVKVGVISYG